MEKKKRRKPVGIHVTKSMHVSLIRHASINDEDLLEPRTGKGVNYKYCKRRKTRFLEILTQNRAQL